MRSLGSNPPFVRFTGAESACWPDLDRDSFRVAGHHLSAAGNHRSISFCRRDRLHPDSRVLYINLGCLSGVAYNFQRNISDLQQSMSTAPGPGRRRPLAGHPDHVRIISGSELGPDESGGVSCLRPRHPRVGMVESCATFSTRVSAGQIVFGSLDEGRLAFADGDCTNTMG